MEDTWTQLMTELNALNAASIQKHRGKLENSIHQSLEPSEDKAKQTRQLNVIAEISRMSMEVVQRELEKNMSKFDLYVRRNALAVPDELRVEIAAIRAREKKKHDKSAAENAKKRALQDAQDRLDATQREVAARRRELQQMDMRMEQLHHDARAVARSQATFRGFLVAQDYILQIPETIVNPLKRTAAEVALLHAHADKIAGIQEALDDDVRTYKRAKADDRTSFVHMHARFLARVKAGSSLTEFANELEATAPRK